MGAVFMTASVMKGLNEKYKDYGKQQLKLRELKIRNKIKTLLQLVLYQSYFATKVLNFEDLIQKVNDSIYLSHFYISDHLTQIHKALFIYHMQFFQKVLVSTICWCNSIFWKLQSLLFVSIFIHYDVKNCSVCSVGMFYTILFTWKFFKNVLQ